eukprot:CAMPEP_0175084742 /NCGR_PEP_ID=MMETSP0052_2-20121109/28243_1 /TAXON_ID=51329 ORGANISM="Polytomella parva, Strain SAG 63-3" /NCGR_SAMPLE_ID=MMETSP0052_2 /ASSEMBLY_ACC=CAM_ASM_000194 /LENGTH=39 /DNA_ID= /DNA_START= /DNA_END= /DNA_ORIENTATION=
MMAGEGGVFNPGSGFGDDNQQLLSLQPLRNGTEVQVDLY